jgi:hypothetical protein
MTKKVFLFLILIITLISTTNYAQDVRMHLSYDLIEVKPIKPEYSSSAKTYYTANKQKYRLDLIMCRDTTVQIFYGSGIIKKRIVNTKDNIFYFNYENGQCKYYSKSIKQTNNESLPQIKLPNVNRNYNVVLKKANIDHHGLSCNYYESWQNNNIISSFTSTHQFACDASLGKFYNSDTKSLILDQIYYWDTHIIHWGVVSIKKTFDNNLCSTNVEKLEEREVSIIDLVD